jgi:hypothetical protein
MIPAIPGILFTYNLCQIRKTLRDPKSLSKLPGHQHFLIAECHYLASRNTADSLHVLIGDLTAADYGNTKHRSTVFRFELRQKRSHRFVQAYSWLPAQPFSKLPVRTAVPFPFRNSAEQRRLLKAAGS